MGKKQDAAETYTVRSALTGAEVVIGVDLDTATSERARLNAEARRIVGMRNGQPVHEGMQRGQLTTYEIVSSGGLVL